MKKLKTVELNRKSPEEYSQTLKLPIIVVLDNIRSMHNVGSIFRTCDAFMVEKIFLCGITAVPPNREINKTALGSTETVLWGYDKNVYEVISKFAEQGYKIIGVEQTDKSIELNKFNPDLNERYVLIFGNEVSGISEEVISLLETSLEIAQYGTKHSLNVSVAAGIVIHYFCNEMINASIN